MEKEVEQYLNSMSLILNGQLRGFINGRAREENKKLIELTLFDVFEKGYNLGNRVKAEKETLRKLKEDLKNDNSRIED